jgi:hypothetical protein
MNPFIPLHPFLYRSILSMPSHLHLDLSSAHKNNVLKSTTRSRKGITLRHEDVWGKGCIDPRILDLGTSWRLVVIFTPQPVYSRGKSLWYPLDRKLGGPQNRSGRRREEKNLAPTGTRTPTPSAVQSVAQCYTDYAIAVHFVPHVHVPI